MDSQKMTEVILPADSSSVGSNVEVCCRLITPIIIVLEKHLAQASRKMAEVVKQHFSSVDAIEQFRGEIKLAIAKGLLKKTELAIYMTSCKDLGPIDRRILQAQQNRVNHLYRRMLKCAFVVVSIVSIYVVSQVINFCS